MFGRKGSTGAGIERGARGRPEKRNWEVEGCGLARSLTGAESVYFMAKVGGMRAILILQLELKKQIG